MKKSAERLIALDFSSVPCNRVTQVSVGWLRSACYQMILIADTTSRGKGHMVAPNRRLLAEIAIRCHWLKDTPSEDRNDAVDAMLSDDKLRERKKTMHMTEMGVNYNPDLAEMDSLILSDKASGQLKDHAINLTHAAKGTTVPNFGLYLAWAQDSTYAHATAIMGGSYAPMTSEGGLGNDHPETPAPNLEVYKSALTLIGICVAKVLADEGTDSTICQQLTAILEPLFTPASIAP